MDISVSYNVTKDDYNMSRVRIEQELAVICSNQSTADPDKCDRSSQGISLSTPILMMAFGVFGNVLALLVLYSSRREAQARRTVFFVMLSGLAWTDLIGQLTVSPIAIITYANNLKWVGGKHLCVYHGFMMVSFGLVMPLIVCCMSVERFLAIKFSYYYARRITRRKAQLTFLACWCFTAVFATLPLLGFGSYELQFPGSWCFLNFHKESTLDAIHAAMFGCFNIIAIVTMIVCNVTVALKLCRMRRGRQLQSSSSGDRKLSISGIGSTTTSGTVIRSKRHSDMEAQMIWFLLLITIAFSVCWLPLNVHILVMQFTGANNRLLDLKVIRMASTNQILDPWLYVIFRKNSILRIIRRIRACWTTKKEPPRNGPIIAPPLRYVMGNKSFSCEPSTLLRTKPHRCGQSPTFCRHVISEVPEESRKGLPSFASTDSATRFMSACPNCDCEQRYKHASSPEINLSLGYSPSSSPVKNDKFEFSITSQNKELNNLELETTLTSLSPPIQSANVPLLDKAGKSSKLPLRFLNSFDTFASTDSYGANHSSDISQHFLTSHAVKNLAPTTPTQTKFPDSQIQDLETPSSSLGGGQEFHKTSKPFHFVFSPLLATPEPDSIHSEMQDTSSEHETQPKNSSPAHIPLSKLNTITNPNEKPVDENTHALGGVNNDVAQTPSRHKTPTTVSSSSNDSELADEVFIDDDVVFPPNHHSEPHQGQSAQKLTVIKPLSSHEAQRDVKYNGYEPDVADDSTHPLLPSDPPVTVHTICTLTSSPVVVLNGPSTREPSSNINKDSSNEHCGKSLSAVSEQQTCLVNIPNDKTQLNQMKDLKNTMILSNETNDIKSGSYLGMNGRVGHNKKLKKQRNIQNGDTSDVTD